MGDWRKGAGSNQGKFLNRTLVEEDAAHPGMQLDVALGCLSLFENQSGSF
jgi:hypothetical protein